ncbi:hypothetical protein BC628DRAFT_1323970 [Trametes gibbosa]|nr:hypothetical protein BC628DRAFT_1323970 [Trametes gibbosa]
MLDPPHSVYYIRSECAAGDGEKAHRLVLTTTSLRNVVLANATDVLYYEVVTPRWERHLTRVSRLDVNTRCFDLVAELVNGHPPAEHSTRSDVLGDAAHGGASANEGERRGRDDDGAKRVVTTEELQLTREDDPDKPLVTFHREKRYLHVLRMSQHPYLEVHPSALESLDYIIGRFVVRFATGESLSCRVCSLFSADGKTSSGAWSYLRRNTPLCKPISRYTPSTNIGCKHHALDEPSEMDSSGTHSSDGYNTTCTGSTGCTEVRHAMICSYRPKSGSKDSRKRPR